MPDLVGKFLDAKISLASLKSWPEEQDENEIVLGWKRFRQMHESESRRGKGLADLARQFFAEFHRLAGETATEKSLRKLAADLAEWASVMRSAKEQE